MSRPSRHSQPTGARSSRYARCVTPRLTQQTRILFESGHAMGGPATGATVGAQLRGGRRHSDEADRVIRLVAGPHHVRAAAAGEAPDHGDGGEDSSTAPRCSRRAAHDALPKTRPSVSVFFFQNENMPQFAKVQQKSVDRA